MSKERVLAAIADERDGMQDGEIDRYLAVLTDDAVFMPPNSAPKTGAELRSWLRAFLADYRVEWLEFASTETVLAADVAFHSYTYMWRLHPRKGGTPVSGRGKGVHLLRRQANGAWKIAREIWNSTPQ